MGKILLMGGAFMNRTRRALLQKAMNALITAENYVLSALEQEQDCRDNIPESLESSDRCVKMDDAIDSLEDAIDNISSAKECIEKASE